MKASNRSWMRSIVIAVLRDRFHTRAVPKWFEDSLPIAAGRRECVMPKRFKLAFGVSKQKNSLDDRVSPIFKTNSRHCLEWHRADRPFAGDVACCDRYRSRGRL